MSFVHLYLLGGLSLLAVPFVVHLITRQKPKHLRFPAFRFLQQRYHTTQNKLRLQHWLLLLLRLLVIACLCLALARPRLFSDRLPLLGENQPVVAILLFDTSLSMEYQQAGATGPAQTRLDVARARAAELLDELPPGSRIAILDSAEMGGEFQTNSTALRDRLKTLELQPANGSLTRQLGQAYNLFARLQEEMDSGVDLPPRFLYLFGDRTFASWDNAEARGLKGKQPEGVQAVFLDVGVEKVVDLSIDKVQVEPPVVAPGGVVRVRATVRATGTRAEFEITCQFDNEPAVERRLVKREEGDSQVITFERRTRAPGQKEGLAEGFHHVVLRLKTEDALPFNNTRYATFAVRPGRSLLTFVDSPDSDDLNWRIGLEVLGFRCEVRPIAELNTFSPEELQKYKVIALFQLTRPPADLWDRLLPFVKAGGGLAVIPAGSDLQRAAYNDNDKARQLMPGEITALITAPTDPGVGWEWKTVGGRHPLLAPFLEWRRTRDIEFQRPEGQPTANRYWRVVPYDTPTEKAEVITTYANADQHPALLDRTVGKGHVLLFTTVLDSRREVMRTNEGKRPWNNYWQNSFGLVLVDKACRYLAGDSDAPQLNYLCGQNALVPLAPDVPGPFKLFGPQVNGILLSEPPAPDGKPREPDLPITRARQPGNYLVKDNKEGMLGAFSLNVRPDESLLERVPVADLEQVLGEGSVLAVDHGTSLKDALNRRPQPVELLPWLMLLLLLFLALEPVLANRNRSAGAEKAAQPPGVPPPRLEPLLPRRSIRTLLVWTTGAVLLGALLGQLHLLGYPGPGVGALCGGLVGLAHGCLAAARFAPRESAILGGLLGSMLGVIQGGVVLTSVSFLDGPVGILLGMVIGAGVLALDGWLVGAREQIVASVPSKPGEEEA